MERVRLRDLPAGMRAGLTGVALALLLGMWASMGHLVEHHQKRDGESGVSLDDVRGAYSGVHRPAPLAAVLQRGHPEGLAQVERESLLAWLAGERISERYDDPDLGDAAPAEVLERGCVTCHARQPADSAYKASPLEYWDDVKALAFERRMDPTPREILLLSTHTHALSMAVVTLGVLALAWATRWPLVLRSLLGVAAGLGLTVDLLSWWLARHHAGFVWGILAGGALWCAAVVAGLLLALLELWLPGREGT